MIGKIEPYDGRIIELRREIIMCKDRNESKMASNK